MAIFCLNVKTMSRSSGGSAVAHAKYILREGRYSRDHDELVHVEHGNMPTWAQQNPINYWKAADLYERENGRLCKKLILALPVELDHEERIALAKEFAEHLGHHDNLPWSLAIHDDGTGNPHAHIAISERSNDGINRSPETWFRRFNAEHPELGGAKKSTSLHPKEWLLDIRAEWASRSNRALARNDHQIRIDHRSFEDQGIDLQPGRHRGPPHRKPKGHTLDRLEEHDRRVRENGEAIAEDPSIALKAITIQQATFTKDDLARYVHGHCAEDQFQRCLDAALASKELVPLEDNGRRFTTKSMLEVERAMLDDARAMAGNDGHQVRAEHIAAAIDARGLSAEQLLALQHVVAAGDLAVVQGYAGAGKSYMLGAARQAWEAQGFRVSGAALAGKAAQGLEESAGIKSRSLHSHQYGWKSGHDELGRGDILVIDEAGMVGSRQLGEVLSYAKARGAKVVLVGDSEQLQAIDAGSPMRAIADRVGQVEMEKIRRQREEWQRQAVRDFRAGRAKEAFKALDENGCIHAHTDQTKAIEKMVAAWNQERQDRPEQSQIMLAYRRKDVQKLNDHARECMREAGALGKDFRIETERGSREFATGDRLYFLKNEYHEMNVRNGSLGTIEAIGDNRITVRLDGPEGRQVSFDPGKYNAIDHGYAATIHKAQGVTVDRAHVLASTQFDRHLAYVGMSRHRDRVDVYVSKEDFSKPGELAAVCSRARRKDLAVDYLQNEKSNQELRQQVVLQKPQQAEHDAPQIHRYPEIDKLRAEFQRKHGGRDLEQEPKQQPHLPIYTREEVEQAKREAAEIQKAHEQKPEQHRESTPVTEQQREESKQERISRWVAEASPKEVLDKYREAQRLSVEKPMTAKEILEGYVERERRELEDGKSAHRFATKRCEDYEKAHPVKARLGSKEFKELVAIKNRMKANVERLQKAYDEKLANPKVQRDAEIEAKQRDMKIREGVAFEKAVQPHVKGLRMTLHKEWEKQRKHDRELQKQRGHGHDPWSRGL